MKFETVDGTRRNIDKIAEMFPQVVTEVLGDDGKLKRAVKWDILKELLSGDYVEGGECYEFTWPGKRAAIAEAAKPIRKTLRPCKEESKNWDTTENLYIEGDNLEVLKLLQESYLGKVKMIYIDPPYNTGNDFIYKDNSVKSKEVSEDELGLFDDETENRTMSGELFKNTEANGKFHSDWCSKLYSPLLIARDLLAENGAIFISIDDNEIENCQKICNDLFGKNNHIATFIVIRSEGGGLAKQAIIGHDYLLIYAKNILTFPPLGKPKDIRGKIVVKNGEEYWIETDWFREVFGQYGTCHYEDILTFYNQAKKDEIDAGLKRGDYILIEKNGKHIVGRYRKVADDTTKFYTILKHLNKNGVADLESLNMAQYFDYPKPVSLLKEIIQGATIRSKEEKNIILDFFSGSATTAHAVFAQNIADGGNRKFIMVQYPEDLDEKLQKVTGNAKKTVESAIELCNSLGTAHYLTEVGKERIRRAGEKILAECAARTNGGGNGDGSGECGGIPDLDIGFRVFKVADSNMKDVYYSAEEYSQDMLDSLVSNIKEDRTDLDLLYGCLLDWGVELSLPHTSETIDNVTVHTVNNGDLIACFDANIPESAIHTIAKRQPLRAVFRDSSFASAPQKINVEEIFKLLSPTTTVKVI